MAQKPVPTAPANKVPTPYETGLKGSLIDFIQADYAAQMECMTKQANARALIKDPSAEKTVEQAAHDAAEIRDALQKGARQAFLEGRHEKIQTLLSEPAKFFHIGFKYNPQTETSLVAKIIIQLMDASPNCSSDIPARALEKVAENKKQRILDHALYLVSSDPLKIEKLAYALLEVGAEADGLVLANAVHSKASPALVALLLESGADYTSAFKILNSNRARYGQSAERFADVKTILTLQTENKRLQAELAQLKENKLDVTVKTTTPKPPGAGSSARHRKHKL